MTKQEFLEVIQTSRYHAMNVVAADKVFSAEFRKHDPAIADILDEHIVALNKFINYVQEKTEPDLIVTGRTDDGGYKLSLRDRR